MIFVIECERNAEQNKVTIDELERIWKLTPFQTSRNIIVKASFFLVSPLKVALCQNFQRYSGLSRHLKVKIRRMKSHNSRDEEKPTQMF